MRSKRERPKQFEAEAYIQDYGSPGRFNFQCSWRNADGSFCEGPAMYVGLKQDRRFKKTVVYRNTFPSRCGKHQP